MPSLNDITGDQIIAAYDNLPPALAAALARVDVSAKVKAIGDSYGMTIRDLGSLAQDVELVIVGLATPQMFTEKLKTDLNLDRPKLQGLIHDINENIFKVIREELHQIQFIENLPEPEPEPAVELTPDLQAKIKELESVVDPDDALATESVPNEDETPEDSSRLAAAEYSDDTLTNSGVTVGDDAKSRPSDGSDDALDVSSADHADLMQQIQDPTPTLTERKQAGTVMMPNTKKVVDHEPEIEKSSRLDALTPNTPKDTPNHDPYREPLE